MRTQSNWTPGQGSPRTIDLLNKTAKDKEEVIMKSGGYISLVLSGFFLKKKKRKKVFQALELEHIYFAAQTLSSQPAQ